jgi:hypothetical protein
MGDDSRSVDGLERLLRSVGARSIEVAQPAEPTAAVSSWLQALPLERTTGPAADVVLVIAAQSAAETYTRIERAAARAAILVLVAGESGGPEAERWAAAHDDWLTLRDPPTVAAMLAPVRTLVDRPDIQGVWYGGRAATAPVAPVRERAPAQSNRPAHVGAREQALNARLGRLQIAQQSQRIEIDRLREAWLEDRAWVAVQAERVLASASWRLGHRVMRILRALSFRRNRGSDALSRIVERMREPIAP